MTYLNTADLKMSIFSVIKAKIDFFAKKFQISDKMVREPNVSPHKLIIKDDDVKECISTE